MVSSDTTRRRRLSVEARRDELLKACLHLIGTRSWDEVSMAQVAEAAGASKPLVYHYFSTKRDLYVAAVRAAADELSEATKPDLDLPFESRALKALGAHIDWIEENALAYRAILQGGVSPDPDVQAIVEASRADVVTRLAESFAYDELAPAQRIALRGWVGFLESACLSWLAAPDISKAHLARLLAASVPGAIAAAAVPAEDPTVETTRPPAGRPLMTTTDPTIAFDISRLDITKQNVAVEKVLDHTENPRHRYLLQAYLRHRYLESAGRWEEILDPQLTVDVPFYRFQLAGQPPFTLEGKDQVGALYGHWTETDQCIFYVEDESVAVGDHMVVGRGIGYQQTLGSELAAAGVDADPEAMYLKRSQIMMLWPYDDQCRLLGEDVWEFDSAEAGLFRLDPADVLTAEQSRQLLDPHIKALPAFDDTMLAS